MYSVKKRKNNLEKRKIKIRNTLVGSKEKPRLSVFRSVRYIYAQLIDDVAGKTLVDISDQSIKYHDGQPKIKAAFELGKLIAERAKEKKISSVVFDRGGYKYHGRVKSLADGAREGGLQF